MPTQLLTRDLPLQRGISALLIIDVQNFCCHRDGGLFRGLDSAQIETEFGPFLDRLESTVIPNLQKTIGICRETDIEASEGPATEPLSAASAAAILAA